MNNIFCGPIAAELRSFLRFKRDLGYGYRRAEFTLREFDSFLIEYVTKNRPWQLDQAALSWLASKPGRKAVSVSDDAGVLRQLVLRPWRVLPETLLGTGQGEPS